MIGVVTYGFSADPKEDYSFVDQAKVGASDMNHVGLTIIDISNPPDKMTLYVTAIPIFLYFNKQQQKTNWPAIATQQIQQNCSTCPRDNMII